MGRVKHLESDDDKTDSESFSPKRRRKESGQSTGSTSAAAKSNKESGQSRGSTSSNKESGQSRGSTSSNKESGQSRGSTSAAAKPNVEQPTSPSPAPSGFTAAPGFAANVQASPSGGHVVSGMVPGSSINAFMPGLAASISQDRAALLSGAGVAGLSAASLSAGPVVATKHMDFSKDAKDVGVTNSVIEVPKQLVAVLMTQEHRQLFGEESGAIIEWVPAERKARVSGSAEQVKQASRLFNRVNIHCLWGVSAVKVRQLLRPQKVESVQCRLSPMGHLPGGRKTLTPRDRTMSVGKGPDNDVICPGSGIVSRQHFLLELDEERGAVYIHDCSTNGTYLNGILLPPRQSGKVFLSHGDEILLKERTSGLNEFGYIVNLQNISVKAEAKLEAPRRLLSPEETRTVGRGD